MLGSGLLSKYREIVTEVFIDDLGKDIILHYENPFPVSISTGIVAPYGFNTFDEFGNPSELSYLGNRNYEDATNQKIVTTTGIIRARVYWLTSNNQLYQLGLKSTDKACKINCRIDDAPKLSRCAWIEIEDRIGSLIKLQSINTKHNLPYGLGESAFGISYWKVF